MFKVLAIFKNDFFNDMMSVKWTCKDNDIEKAQTPEAIKKQNNL